MCKCVSKLSVCTFTLFVQIAQLTQQLQVGVGQYQKLHQVATQLQQQLIQQQQQPATTPPQTPPQSGHTPPTGQPVPPRDNSVCVIHNIYIYRISQNMTSLKCDVLNFCCI